MSEIRLKIPSPVLIYTHYNLYLLEGLHTPGLTPSFSDVQPSHSAMIPVVSKCQDIS